MSYLSVVENIVNLRTRNQVIAFNKHCTNYHSQKIHLFKANLVARRAYQFLKGLNFYVLSILNI